MKTSDHGLIPYLLVLMVGILIVGFVVGVMPVSTCAEGWQAVTLGAYEKRNACFKHPGWHYRLPWGSPEAAQCHIVQGCEQTRPDGV